MLVVLPSTVDYLFSMWGKDIRFHVKLTWSMMVYAYSYHVIQVLWILEIYSLARMGFHPCITRVGFERAIGVTLKYLKCLMNECVLNKANENVDLNS